MKPILASIIGFTFALCPAFASPRANVKPKTQTTPPAPPAMIVAPFELPAPKSRGSIRGPVFLPRGAKNVAFNRPVTSSVRPFMGGDLTQVIGVDLTQAVDGVKADFSGNGFYLINPNFVGAPKLTPWVQISLQSPFVIHGVLIWHNFFEPKMYEDVIVQLSDDPDFREEVRTVYNNDADNSAGFGHGTDKEYLEDFQGHWIPIKAQKAGYVRIYGKAKGIYHGQCEYAEIEVWATDVKPVVDSAAKPAPAKTVTPKPTSTKPTPPPGMMVAPFELPFGNVRNARRAPVYLPKGSSNVAHGRPGSSSALPLFGHGIGMINDGVKASFLGNGVRLPQKRQWVQISLESPYIIHGILLWHNFFQPRTYHDVIVQLADDAEFKTNVRTVFNNDHDNSSGLGRGKDPEYVEDLQGHWIPVKSQEASYVRLYSRGSNGSPYNEYAEVEVWATVAPGMMRAPFQYPPATYQG